MTDVIGRLPELEALEELLHHAREGRSGVLVVEGVAGIGKTTLLEAAVAAAEGFRVLRVDGVESERALAFAAIHRLLLPVLDELGELPERQREALEAVFGLRGATPERFLVGLATLTLLTDVAEAGPLLCVVDDAQWIDRESLEIISFVGRRLQVDGVALLLAMRVGPGGSVHGPEGLPRLSLEGLHPVDVRSLVALIAGCRVDAGVADRIVREAQGSPLAILEVVSALSEEQLAGGRKLPAALPIGARLETHFLDQVSLLPPDARSLLLVVAADSSGDPAIVPAAARSLSLSVDAAEPAVRVGLLTDGPSMRFRHPLIRSAVYRGAASEDRRQVHLALAAATDRDLDPEGHAWHLASSTAYPDDSIAADLWACGERAHEGGGFAAAAALQARSAELTVDPALRAERFLAAARSHHVAGAPTAAADLLSLAEPGLGDERHRIDALRLRAVMDTFTTPREVAANLLDAAKRLTPLDPDQARETFGEAVQASLVTLHLTLGTTPADVARAALASGLLDDGAGAADLLHRGFAKRLALGYAEAVPDLAGAVEAALVSGEGVDGLQRWEVLVNYLAAELWDADGPVHLQRVIETDERDRGALGRLRVTLGAVAHILMWRGRFAEADALHSEAAAISIAMGETPVGWDLLKVELWAWQGDEERTRPTAELLAGEEAEHFGAGVLANVARMATVTLDLAGGRYREAFDAGWPVFRSDPPAQGNQVLPSLVEAAIRCGEADAAHAACARLAERAMVTHTPWALGVAARAKALVALDDPKAEAHYCESLHQLEQSPVEMELARTQLVYGEWLRRQNRPLDARDQLAPAVDGFGTAGALGFEKRARMELAATGTVARKRPRDSSSDLTPQEHQIARLAADGDTNREIAAKLYISGSTVDYHLRKVFPKLGITSRRQLRKVLDASPLRDLDA